MKTMCALIKRNTKLFFADKALFFVSLITPAILLVLYVTFLGNVYTDSLQMAAGGMEIPEKIMKGFAGAQLISSILAVSCVTVAFCSNMLMVQDKANGTLRDLTVFCRKGPGTVDHEQDQISTVEGLLSSVYADLFNFIMGFPDSRCICQV